MTLRPLNQPRHGRRAVALPSAAVLALLVLASGQHARAASVYADDFAGGSTTGWTLPAYGSIASLPTDSGGLGSANQAQWLKIDSQQPKFNDELATLSLGGLQAGQTYTVSFNLFIGASWDGSAGYYGPDEWKLQVKQTGGVSTLVDATFANGKQGVNFGADSRQSYSADNPVAGTGLLYERFTGSSASYSLNQGGNYGSDYSIYKFGQGTGTPTLHFVATGATADLVFQRVGIPSGDSADEYWGVSHVSVTSSVPEPSSVALVIGGGIVCLALTRKRRMPVSAA